jgi:hypothetical protein
MKRAPEEIREAGPENLPSLLRALDETADQAARKSGLELVRAVIALHGAALAELLAIVEESATQPAETLLAKFAANPAISGVLLLHDLHPQDLAMRARQALEHLHPHLGVRGIRADLAGAEGGIVRIRVSATGQHTQRPPAADLRREVTDAVLAVAPDLVDVVIDGLESASQASEIYVPLASITSRVASR